MSIADVRVELAARLEQVDVNGAALRVIPYIGDQVNPPCAVIGEAETFIDYGVALDDITVVYNFEVSVLVGRTSERAAQGYLDELRGMSGGVRAALETSGNVLDFVNVLTSSRVQVFTVGAVDYLGCTFAVEASES